MAEVTFQIEGNVLKKCVGNAELIEIPEGCTEIKSGACAAPFPTLSRTDRL